MDEAKVNGCCHDNSKYHIITNKGDFKVVNKKLEPTVLNKEDIYEMNKSRVIKQTMNMLGFPKGVVINGIKTTGEWIIDDKGIRPLYIKDYVVLFDEENPANLGLDVISPTYEQRLQKILLEKSRLSRLSKDYRSLFRKRGDVLNINIDGGHHSFKLILDECDGFFLSSSSGINHEMFKWAGLESRKAIDKCLGQHYRDYGGFPYMDTLEDLNILVDFLMEKINRCYHDLEWSMKYKG
jgi:hypothetical protein